MQKYAAKMLGLVVPVPKQTRQDFSQNNAVVSSSRIKTVLEPKVRNEGGFGWLQYELMEVALHNHVLHRVHCLLEKIGVGSIRVVHVHLLVGVAHKSLEPVGEELLRPRNVGDFAVIVGEVFVDWAHARRQFFAEEVHLVEKQDERRLGEVAGVGYLLEEHERFRHLVLMRSDHRRYLRK